MIKFIFWLLLITLLVSCILPFIPILLILLFTISCFLLCLAPIFAVCALHMKIKGYTEHTYKFLGFTIKITLKGGKKNG